MASGRLDESRRIIQDAFNHKLDAINLHSLLYRIAFVSGDTRAMAEQVAWSDGKPEAAEEFFSLQSSSEAYFGHVQNARTLSRRAAEAAERSGNAEAATSERMRHALNEVAFGYKREARQLALSVLSEPSVGDDAEASGALVFAWLGEVARSERVLDEVSKRFPHGTLMQSVVLPTVRAKLELTKGNAERSVELLQANIPYELTPVSFNGCLYPAYVRGEAALARRNGGAAEVEFEKILNHRGLVGNCETVALARLGLARAYALQGNAANAKAAYSNFLTLWKDADPDIPILKQAKSEYAKLQ
jgi:hypothetical protein